MGPVAHLPAIDFISCCCSCSTRRLFRLSLVLQVWRVSAAFSRRINGSKRSLVRASPIIPSSRAYIHLSAANVFRFLFARTLLARRRDGSWTWGRRPSGNPRSGRRHDAQLSPGRGARLRSLRGQRAQRARYDQFLRAFPIYACLSSTYLSFADVLGLFQRRSADLHGPSPFATPEEELPGATAPRSLSRWWESWYSGQSRYVLWARLFRGFLTEALLPKCQISPPIQHRQQTILLRGTLFRHYHLGPPITMSGRFLLATWPGAPILSPIQRSLTHSVPGQPFSSRAAILSRARCPNGALERGPL